MLVNDRVPYSKHDPIYYYSMRNFHGMSFMLNADVLLYNAYKHTYKDVAIYAGIASIRPVANYIAHQTLTLPLRYCPVVLGDHLEDETLLTVDDDDNIHFLYEQPPSSLIN